MKPLCSCLFSLVLLAGAGCKKNNDDNASRMDIITSGQWHMTAFTASPAFDIDGDGVPESDVYATLEACEKDNFFVFKKDGKGEINEGATKCDATDPQTETIDWALSADEKQITIDGDRTTILELTNARMRLQLALLSSTAELTFTR